MSKLNCPVCGKSLTQVEYDKALGLWKAKQLHIKHLEAERQQLKKQELAYKRQAKEQARQLKRDRAEMRKEMRKQLSAQARESRRQLREQQVAYTRQLAKAVKRGVEKGVRKQQIALRKSQNKMSQLEKSLKRAADRYKNANEEITRLKKQIEQGITPQIEGLLEEKNLLAKLRELYPQDRFQHTGKGGDILQTVVDHGKDAGLIVYECKKVKTFSASHVAQAKQARSQRQADFAVLVTNAFPKKKQHYFVEKNVFVISPVSVEPISYTLRESLVRIAMLKLSNQAKQEAVQRVYDYLSSSEYNTKMNGIAEQLMDLGRDLKSEIDTHGRVWRKRYSAYRALFTDIGGIDHQLRVLVHGLGTGKVPELLPAAQRGYVEIEELQS